MKSSAVLNSALLRTLGKYLLLAAMVGGIFASPYQTSAQSVVTLQALSSAKLATRKLLSNWGQDNFWYPIQHYSGSSGLITCTSSVTPNTLNAIYYREDSYGSKIKVVDNVASPGVPHETPVSLLGQVFTAASDQGSNFAYYSTVTDTLKYTVDSGATWVTIPFMIPGVTQEINHHGQMLFGSNGVLYVFYFTFGGTFNVLKVIPTSSAPYYTVQNQVINSTSGITCSYSTCWASATKTHNHVIVAFAPGRDTWQGYAPWGVMPWQWQLPSYYTINATNGQTHLGSIGEDPTWSNYCTPDCQETNDERIMLASDGTHIFAARRTGNFTNSFGLRKDYGISDIGTIDANGALTDNNNFPTQLNPNGPTDPLTNLAAIPATELGTYMGELTSIGQDPIRNFAAPMRPANFSGARSVDVVFWDKDATGWANSHTRKKYRITNPNNAPGIIYSAPLEDITESQLPPGYIVINPEGQGGQASLSSVMNATVASFCKWDVTCGSMNCTADGYYILDSK